ncbi:uncharacterized protein M421DRAFT_73636, partial [Didymella exigua CBS 183.55]
LFTKGASCAIQFNKAKTELIYFITSNKAISSCRSKDRDRSTLEPKKTVKWLGIYFNNALSFKEHAATRISQARNAFYRMCRLANSNRGLPPCAVRQLYLACVSSIADYSCWVF